MTKKQSGPTEIISTDNNISGTAPGPMGGRSHNSDPSSIPGSRPLRGSNSGQPGQYYPLVPMGPLAESQPRTYHTAGSAQANPHHQVHQQPTAEIYPTGGNASPASEAPAANKIKVPPESTYPKPSKDQDLIKIFVSRPDLFEEFLKAQIESVVNKKVQDSVAPFKAEVGRMINVLTRSNADEVSTLSSKLTEAQSQIEGQSKELVGLSDRLKVTSSEIKLLESTGIKHSSIDEQSSSLEKVRDHLRAEVNLVVNSRIKEELQFFDEKVNKKFEETDKRVKGVEKKTDGFKDSIEENKKEQEHLLARVDDISKLVAELTMGKTPKNDHQEEIEALRQSLANIGKYREDDLRKIESLSTVVEENKKASANKVDTLEKFVISMKEAKEKEAQAPQVKTQSNFEANANVMQDLKAVKSSADNFSYKIDTIKYDLELIKGDIVRQKETQKDYFMKIDKLEKRVDSLPGTATNFYASHNFMTNQTIALKPNEDNNILAGLKNERSDSKRSGSTQEGGSGGYNNQRPAQAKPANNYDFMKELDDEFSIIDGNGRNDQSAILDNDIFSNQAHRQSSLGVNPIDAGLGVHHTQKISSTADRPGANYPPTSTYIPPGNSTIGQASKGLPPQPVTQQHQGPVTSGPQPSNLGYQGQPYQISPPYPGQNHPYPSFNSSQPQPHTVTSPTYPSHQQPYQGQPSYQASTPAPTYQPGSTSAKTTSVFTQQPPLPPMAPQSSSNQPALSRRVTSGLEGAGNSSLLNQSLNTSIRMQKSQLKKMDQSIHDAVATRKDADDSDEIELNIDDNGFLIDERGFPILNDKGEPMKLSEEQIEALKEQGLYEEKEVSSMD